jgi:hypothetical protein
METKNQYAYHVISILLVLIWMSRKMKIMEITPPQQPATHIGPNVGPILPRTPQIKRAFL